MCGLFGVRGDKAAARIIYAGLHAEQHRAQESGGIATSLGGREILCQHGRGIIQDAITEGDLNRLRGQCGIGHIRYATTTDREGLLNAQPIVSSFGNSQVAIAHNGNLTNYRQLRRRIGEPFQTSMDTEVALKRFCLSRQTDLFKRVHEAVRELKGAYSLLFLFRDVLIAVRDPRGVRPLSLGRRNGAWLVASETVALESVHAEVVRDILPGEILIINQNGLKSRYFDTQRLSDEPLHQPLKQCIFEWLYFASPASEVFGVPVAQWRIDVGSRLADLFPIQADAVVPVPDSAIFFAEGYAQASGIPYVKGLLRSHYISRTFIEPTKASRIGKATRKFQAVRNLIRGKRVIAMEDSIVRLTTFPRVVRMLREAGATEVHGMIATPLIKGPCFYGIDTPHKRELIAATHQPKEILRLTGADSLHFMPLQELYRLSGDRRNFCFACMNDEYFDL